MSGAELLPLFVLRGAGFPVGDALLPGVGDGHRETVRLAALERQSEALHRALVAVLAGEPLERAERHRVRRRLRAGAVVDGEPPTGPGARDLLDRWNRLVGELAEARERAERRAEAELASAQRALRSWHAGARAAEAVWFSSHSAAAGLASFARGAQSAATMRRVALRYLQRLATKNETTSFFGPFQYGEVVEGGAGLLLLDPDSPRHGPRSTFLARYAVEGLAKRIAAELAAQPGVPLSLHPLARLEQDGLRIGKRSLALPEPLVRALGRGPVAAAEVPGPSAAAVRRLVRAGLLTVPLSPASTSLTELADLRASVAALGPAAPAPVAAWLDRLDAVGAAVERVRSTAWPERRAAVAEVEALLGDHGLGQDGRPTGSLYADRQPVYEECVGGLRGLALNRAEFTRTAQPLCTVLRVHAAYAALVRADAREWLRTHWEKTGLPARTGLYGLLDGLQGFPQPDYREGSPAADALWRRLDAVAPAGSHRVELTAARLAELFADALPEETFVCSPDLMVRRTPTGDRLVVGEIHHGIQPWSWLAGALPEERRQALRRTVGAWARELAASLAGPESLPVTLVEPRFTGKTFTLEYPGLALERMGRSALPRDQVLGLHDVVADRDAFALRTRDGRPLALMPTGPVSPLSRAFGGLALWGPRSAPLEGHRPRVTVDGLVWFRETWRLTAARLAALAAARTPAAVLSEAHRLRERLGLPRFVYAKPDGEPKPVFVDLESVAYCDMLARLAAGAPGAVVSEMLPGPDELVLHCADGSFTSELRMSMLVRSAG